MPWAAAQQSFPSKPVRIVTSEAGGALDFVARLTAQGLTFGQRVIVDNRSGGTVVVVDIMSKAPPDGHTLMYIGSTLWLAPLLRDNIQYDTLRDFAPITLAVAAPSVLVVHPPLPVRNVKELIALLKARPGELNYSASATAGSSHLAGELFKALAGVNVVRIPYKGNGPALTGLIAGETQMMFANAAGVTPHIKSGRLRALAVTSAKPSDLIPDLPTVAASGLPGYEATTVYAIFAPARTPGAIVAILNRELVRVLMSADTKAKLMNNGAESVASSPQQLAAAIQGETIRMGKVIRDAGIRED